MDDNFVIQIQSEEQMYLIVSVHIEDNIEPVQEFEWFDDIEAADKRFDEMSIERYGWVENYSTDRGWSLTLISVATKEVIKKNSI